MSRGETQLEYVERGAETHWGGRPRHRCDHYEHCVLMPPLILAAGSAVDCPLTESRQVSPLHRNHIQAETVSPFGSEAD